MQTANVYHPRPDDSGKPVLLKQPSKPTPAETWSQADRVASTVPDGAMPAELNGIPFVRWSDVPQSHEAWNTVIGQNDVGEPPFVCPKGKAEAAGVVVCEPDGRVWLVSPSTGYAGYQNTFPKGRIEKNSLRQAAAIREAFEESGLQVEITGFLVDSVRSLTYTRYYLGRRIGGTPAAMGWESQAVHLVPRKKLGDFLHHVNDQPLVKALESAIGQSTSPTGG
jgi:8-oxo-dGTP pyrophosphatase MutT (NUDIX family)